MAKSPTIKKEIQVRVKGTNKTAPKLIEIVKNVFSFKGQLIKGTRPAIIKKLKSLGINNPKLIEVQRQVMANKNVRTIGVSQITANLMNKLTAGKGMGLGKTVGGPGNPGMKPDELAKSKLETKPKTVFNKKKTSTTTTNQKKTSTKTQPKTQPKTQSSPNMKTKINNLANKVKAKMPNVKMSTIVDTIRSQIQKRPLTAVAGATGVGFGLATIIEALKPSKLPTDKEMKAMFGEQNKKQKEIGGGKKKTIPALPISRPKNISKKKTAPVKKQEKLYNLIAGGKGTAKQRLAEEDAAKRFKKIRGRNPSNKELVTFMDKGNKMFSGAMKMFKKKK